MAAGAPVHAYLFIGPRGCGKQEAARAFAAALVCPDRWLRCLPGLPSRPRGRASRRDRGGALGQPVDDRRRPEPRAGHGPLAGAPGVAQPGGGQPEGVHPPRVPPAQRQRPRGHAEDGRGAVGIVDLPRARGRPVAGVGDHRQPVRPHPVRPAVPRGHRRPPHGRRHRRRPPQRRWPPCRRAIWHAQGCWRSTLRSGSGCSASPRCPHAWTARAQPWRGRWPACSPPSTRPPSR
jgi:DNA polymerase III delta prime subunit